MLARDFERKHRWNKIRVYHADLIFIKLCLKISQKTKRNYCYFLINYDNILKNTYPSYREDVTQTCWGKGVEEGIIISTEWSTLHFFCTFFSAAKKFVCAYWAFWDSYQIYIYQLGALLYKSLLYKFCLG